MAFDRDQAKAAGYTEQEIDAYLASKNRPGRPSVPAAQAPPARRRLRPETATALADALGDFGRHTSVGGIGGIGGIEEHPGMATLTPEQRQAVRAEALAAYGTGIAAEAIPAGGLALVRGLMTNPVARQLLRTAPWPVGPIVRMQGRAGRVAAAQAAEREAAQAAAEAAAPRSAPAGAVVDDVLRPETFTPEAFRAQRAATQAALGRRLVEARPLGSTRLETTEREIKTAVAKALHKPRGASRPELRRRYGARAAAIGKKPAGPKPKPAAKRGPSSPPVEIGPDLQAALQHSLRVEREMDRLGLSHAERQFVRRQLMSAGGGTR